MKRLLKWIAILFKCLPKVTWDYFTYILPYSRHKEKYPLELRYRKARKTILFILKKMKINPLDFDNIKPIESQGKLIIGNHLSFLDPLLLIALSEKPIGFVAKEEARKLPFVGKLITIIDGIFIDRNDPIATLRKFRPLAKLIKENKMGYGIFPEGTRNKFPYGMMNEFHPGAFKLAQMAELDIQPIVLFGEQRILEEKIICRNYPWQFRQLDPIPLEEIGKLGTSEFAKKVYGIIDKPLQEMIKIDMAYFQDGLEKKKAPKWWKVKKKPEGEETNENETAKRP